MSPKEIHNDQLQIVNTSVDNAKIQTQIKMKYWTTPPQLTNITEDTAKLSRRLYYHTEITIAITTRKSIPHLVFLTNNRFT